jgi:hypothetical protein
MSGILSFVKRVNVPSVQASLIQASRAEQYNGLDYTVQGAIAMAASFSPDTSLLPFYCKFPMAENTELFDSVWSKWLMHDVTTMVNSYKDSLTLLSAIQIDCGLSDEIIYKENVDFSTTLTENSIEHIFEEYAGDHINKIDERIETRLLPFFSEHLESPFILPSQIEGPQLFSFQAYPNPAGEILHIRTTEADNYTFEVYTLNGQLVSKGNFTGTQHVLNLLLLAKGIYILSVGTESNVVYDKIAVN